MNAQELCDEMNVRGRMTSQKTDWHLVRIGIEDGAFEPGHRMVCTHGEDFTTDVFLPDSQEFDLDGCGRIVRVERP